MGNGSTTNTGTPAQTNGLTSVVAVSAGTYHSPVLKSDGTVWPGPQRRGPAGQRHQHTHHHPVQVTGLTNIIAVSACGYHNLALHLGGTVWAWGNNAYGQPGNGTAPAARRPSRRARSPASQR